jgi:hypothetical protein
MYTHCVQVVCTGQVAADVCAELSRGQYVLVRGMLEGVLPLPAAGGQCRTARLSAVVVGFVDQMQDQAPPRNMPQLGEQLNPKPILIEP